jgi:diguanylate cyclase (GGDEF)-like protein
LAAIKIQDKSNQQIPNPTVSQGIATLPEHAKDDAELVDTADRALYRAKALGRDKIVIYNPGD